MTVLRSIGAEDVSIKGGIPPGLDKDSLKSAAADKALFGARADALDDRRKSEAAGGNEQSRMG